MRKGSLQLLSLHNKLRPCLHPPSPQKKKIAVLLLSQILWLGICLSSGVALRPHEVWGDFRAEGDSAAGAGSPGDIFTHMSGAELAAGGILSWGC